MEYIISPIHAIPQIIRNKLKEISPEPDPSDIKNSPKKIEISQALQLLSLKLMEMVEQRQFYTDCSFLPPPFKIFYFSHGYSLT